MEVREERMCSSNSLKTSALHGVSGQLYVPAALVPREGPSIRIVQEAGWAPDPVWKQRLEKNLFPPPGIEPRSPGPPVRSQTLYWLSNPSSKIWYHNNKSDIKVKNSTPKRRWIWRKFIYILCSKLSPQQHPSVLYYSFELPCIITVSY
jgi:hypothetical protein